MWKQTDIRPGLPGRARLVVGPAARRGGDVRHTHCWGSEESDPPTPRPTAVPRELALPGLRRWLVGWCGLGLRWVPPGPVTVRVGACVTLLVAGAPLWC